MGYYSVILVLNDMLGEIERDAKFGERVAMAINRFGPPGTSKERMFGNDIGWSASVIQVAHADTVSLLMAGGNRASVLGVTSNQGRYSCSSDERDVLRIVLKRLGYELRGRRKEATDLNIVEKVGRLSEGDQLREALAVAHQENLVLRQTLARVQKMLNAAQDEIGETQPRAAPTESSD